MQRSFNDDDWYVIDTATNTIVAHYGSKNRPPPPKAGEIVVRGMTAKYMTLA